eukprot:TRINITY_DN2949_c0_g1_i2.p1 TRINITY_DN2949_c0_g1~~TRINITY_DN2949_c0_g1_i2.p1  ORF type:complete len:566 (-),score=100.38 TRINITY_DN2949_c0_g1_i2:48-1745(-)
MGSAVRVGVGCGILAGAYTCLLFGLFGTLISYSYTVTFSKRWFEDTSEYALIELVFNCLPELEGRKVFIVPPTERSVLTPPWAPVQAQIAFSEAFLFDVPRTFLKSLEALSSDHVEAQVPQLSPVFSPVWEAAHRVRSSVLAPDVVEKKKKLPRWLGDAGESMLPFLPESVKEGIICPIVRQVAESQGLSSVTREVNKTKGRGVINELLDAANRGETGYAPAIAFSMFAIGVPVVKLLLCVFWSMGVAGDKVSWLALRAAAYLGRWAAVDCVAEALLVAMMLKGGVDAELDNGYAAFVGYVVLSAISLSILDNYVDGVSTRSERRQSLISSRVVDSPVAPRSQIVLAFISFLIVLGVGAVVFPLASLHVKEATIEDKVAQSLNSIGGDGMDILDQFKPGASASLVKSIAKNMPRLSAQTSMYEAARTLMDCKTTAGMVGGFALAAMVLIFPAAEACFSMCVVFRGSCHGLVDVLGDMHLLDVFVVGTFIGIFVVGAVNGLHAHSMFGLYTMAVAAILYWIFQFLVAMHMQSSRSTCCVEAPSFLKSCEKEALSDEEPPLDSSHSP